MSIFIPQFTPESAEDIEAIIEKILAIVQPEPFDGFESVEVEARVSELDGDIEHIQMKLDELELAGKSGYSAHKAYLDREDLVNPINEKQFKKLTAVNKRVEEEKRREAGRKRYPRRSVPARNYAELEVPNEDRFIFCDECHMEYLGDCPEHGPLVIVSDKVAKR